MSDASQIKQTTLAILTVNFKVDGKIIEVPAEQKDLKIEELRNSQISFSYQDNNGFWKHFEFADQLSDDEERIRQMNS